MTIQNDYVQICCFTIRCEPVCKTQSKSIHVSRLCTFPKKTIFRGTVSKYSSILNPHYPPPPSNKIMKYEITGRCASLTAWVCGDVNTVSVKLLLSVSKPQITPLPKISFWFQQDKNIVKFF